MEERKSRRGLFRPPPHGWLIARGMFTCAVCEREHKVRHPRAGTCVRCSMRRMKGITRLEQGTWKGWLVRVGYKNANYREARSFGDSRYGGSERSLRAAVAFRDAHDGPTGKGLTHDQVRAIRALKGEASIREVSERFGISKVMVWKIQSGRAWKNVPDLSYEVRASKGGEGK